MTDGALVGVLNSLSGAVNGVFDALGGLLVTRTAATLWVSRGGSSGAVVVVVVVVVVAVSGMCWLVPAVVLTTSDG